MRARDGSHHFFGDYTEYWAEGKALRFYKDGAVSPRRAFSSWDGLGGRLLTKEEESIRVDILEIIREYHNRF